MKINGSLVFDASSSSEIENLRVQKYADFASVPTYTAADAGRLVYAVDTGTVYYGHGILADWLQLASGGTAFSQTEGDAIETSLGDGIDTDGTFLDNAFNSPISSPTSFTDAINQLAALATGDNTLASLDDVDVATVGNGHYLRFNGSLWVNDALTLSDVAGVTASASELNALTGAGAVFVDFVKLHAVTATADDLNVMDGVFNSGVTSTEISFLNGLTDSVQNQLDAKQGLDSTLTALAALDGTPGILAVTGADAFARRTLTGTANNIVVANGSGSTANPTIDLATVSQTGGGSFVKVVLDSFGRVTGNTAVVTADITTLVDASYVNVGGDTMSGSLTLSGGSSHVVLPNAPTLGTHATNKNYVDSFSQGLSWKQAVRVATTGNVVIATELENGDVVDDITLVTGDRVLVREQTASEENGIYVVLATGAAIRTIDLDTAIEFSSAAVFVQEGTLYADTGWTQTAEVVTLGTDAVNWVQFTGAGVYAAGLGLALSGNTFNVNFGSGIAQLPSDEVGIDLFNTATGALILTTTGSNRSTLTGAQLHLLLKSAGGLTQDVDGLYIAGGSVANAMLVNSVVGLNADSGASTLALGQTLLVSGNATQGIVTAVSGQIINVTASNATDTQKGVASFSSDWFTVTAGEVEIASGSITNGELQNSSISFVGTDLSSDIVELGESLTFASGAPHVGDTLVKVHIDGNIATFTVREATTATTGVVSFDNNHFSITGGAVSLQASTGNLTNATATDNPADGWLMVGDTLNWVKASAASVAADYIALGDLSNVINATPDSKGVLTGNGSAWETQQIYYLHTQGSTSATWTVTHSLGQQYCNVTVIDATDNVVIPQSIVFDSTTQLTVTFNTAVAGKVVVMGIA